MPTCTHTHTKSAHTKQNTHQNFPLIVYIIRSLLCPKVRGIHTLPAVENILSRCVYIMVSLSFSHTHIHTNRFIRGRGLMIQRTLGACMDMHIHHRSVRVWWPAPHNELNIVKVSLKVCSEYLITVRVACFSYKILICSPAHSEGRKCPGDRARCRSSFLIYGMSACTPVPLTPYREKCLLTNRAKYVVQYNAAADVQHSGQWLNGSAAESSLCVAPTLELARTFYVLSKF